MSGKIHDYKLGEDVQVKNWAGEWDPGRITTMTEWIAPGGKVCCSIRVTTGRGIAAVVRGENVAQTIRRPPPPVPAEEALRAENEALKKRVAALECTLGKIRGAFA